MFWGKGRGGKGGGVECRHVTSLDISAFSTRVHEVNLRVILHATLKKSDLG